MNDSPDSNDVRGPLNLKYLDPDSSLAYFFLSIVALAGMFYANLMPVFVGTLIDGLQFSKQQAGLVASLNTYGTTFGAVAAIILIGKIEWKVIVSLAFIPFILLDVLSPFFADATILMSIRFVSGAFGGLITTVCIGVAARTKQPDRAYGMLFACAYGFGGLAMILIPPLVDTLGGKALFFSLAGVSTIALLLVQILPRYKIRDVEIKKANPTPKTMSRLPIIFALASVFLYQCASMSIFSYAQRLGLDAGLATKSVNLGLGIASWLAIGGALLVVAIGLRFGRTRPISVAMTVTFVGVFLLHYVAHGQLFHVALILIFVSGAYLVPYLFGISAALDPTGRMATAAGLSSKLGLATGPLIAAFVIRGDDYTILINLAIAGMFFCLVCALRSATYIENHSEAT